MNKLYLLGLVLLAACQAPTSPKRCDTVVGAWIVITRNPGPGQRVDSIPAFYDQCSGHWVKEP